MNKPTYVRGPLRRAVLAYLRAHPGSTPDAIGAALGDLLKRDDKDKAKGASQLCQRLYDAGFLFRQKAPNTHGQYAYMLTPKAMGEAPPDIKVADDRVSLPAAEPAAQAQCADADDNVLTEEDTELDALRYYCEQLQDQINKLIAERDSLSVEPERIKRMLWDERNRHAETRRKLERVLSASRVGDLRALGITVEIDTDTVED